MYSTRLAALAFGLAAALAACGARSGLEVDRWAGDASGDAGPIVRVTDAIDIAAGDDTTCLIRDGGRISCWGVRLGALPFSSDDTPVELFVRPETIGVDVGTHGCLLDSSGGISCWGENCSGQLGTVGDGTLTRSTNLVPIAEIDDAIELSVGGAHTCVLRRDRSVWCWGYGAHGELGDGVPVADALWDECETYFPFWRDPRGRLEPRPVAGIRDATHVSAGLNHSCAIVGDGEVWCWGGGSYGELGDGLGVDSATPVRVVGIDDAVQLSTGGWRTCAVRRSGVLTCWGREYLGNGANTSSPVPVDAVRVTALTQVDVGGELTCAVSRETPWAWGGLLARAPGDGDPALPGAVVACDPGAGPFCTTFVPATRRVACAGGHGCLLQVDGVVRCWGRGDRGALGGGTSPSSRDYAGRVAGPLGGD